jgi:hypothetical protein
MNTTITAAYLYYKSVSLPPSNCVQRKTNAAVAAKISEVFALASRDNEDENAIVKSASASNLPLLVRR